MNTARFWRLLGLRSKKTRDRGQDPDEVGHVASETEIRLMLADRARRAFPELDAPGCSPKRG